MSPNAVGREQWRPMKVPGRRVDARNP
jgi:hypothetical protein